MTAERANAIFDEITRATEGSDDLLPLKRDLLVLSVRYARLRTDWRLADLETRRGMDSSRRMSHDALIGACNILSRMCARAERPTEWRAKLGDDRREIGDFACYAHAILGVLAR